MAGGGLTVRLTAHTQQLMKVSRENFRSVSFWWRVTNVADSDRKPFSL